MSCCSCFSFLSPPPKSKEKLKSPAKKGKKGGAAEKEGADENNNPKLLDQYELDGVLGQGAFGVVYKCHQIETGRTYAVKMVDQVETPFAEIKREVEMLEMLRHPTVMSIVEVFYEKVFVCIVMELYAGGDLMKGMAAHWKAKGMIKIPDVARIAQQMWMSVAFIHSRSCIHRDLKGDNFMMSEEKVESPTNKLYMADFGTVRAIQPAERINSRCGTVHYWAPELYKKNYSLPVDCWATGVIMYGLCSGKFPFNNESEVMNKSLNFANRVPAVGQEFVKKALKKEEEKRLTGQQALEHPFIKAGGTAPNKDAAGAWAAVSQDGSPVPDKGAAMVEFGADAGVKERRKVLVDRLQKVAGHAPDGAASVTVRPTLREDGRPMNFQIEDPKRHRTICYEWWPAEQASGLIPKSAKPFTNITKDIQAEDIQKLLIDHNIDMAAFGKGKAKTFECLVSEIQEGKARLMIDAAKYKSLVRVVDYVLVCICVKTPKGKRYLVSTMEESLDGDWKNQQVVLYGEKKKAHENARQAVDRLMKTVFEVLPKEDMRWDYDSVEEIEIETPSPAYPHMRTVYKKDVVRGTFVSKDEKLLANLDVANSKKVSFIATTPDSRRTMKWYSKSECEEHNLKVTDLRSDQISALVYPPIGLNEQDLNKFLTNHNVDLSQWGTGNTKSLAEFSEELVKGEATLVFKGAKMQRVVDIVVLRIVHAKRQEMLVETIEQNQQRQDKASTEQRLERLPAVKRRADEHQFLAAKRVLKELKLDENSVNLDLEGVTETEELQDSKSYTGLLTLYRKRFITATMVGSV